MFSSIILHIDYYSLYYFLVINSFYALLIVRSFFSIVQRFREVDTEDLTHIIKSKSLPAISLIIPAYNEADGIIDCVESLLHVRYPVKQLVIVNDGSTDTTLEKLLQEYELRPIPQIFPKRLETAEVHAVYQSNRWPELFVLDKERGGKGDALNAGINFSITPLYLAADADTLIERDALLRMIRPFLDNPSIVAEGATIRMLNGCHHEHGIMHTFEMPKSIVESIQVVEYLRAFLYGRLGWNHFGGNVIVSGAFGLFDREEVLRCGGYSPDSIAEDIELTVELTKRLRHVHKKNTTHFVPDPVAWTQGPKTWKDLGIQRVRWHRALIDTLYRHRGLVFNHKYGMAGMLALPFQLFAELLHPFVEILAYTGVFVGAVLGLINLHFIILFFMVTWGITLILSIFSVMMEVITFKRVNRFADLLRLSLAAFLEHIGYRQAYLFWKLKAFFQWSQRKITWTEEETF